MWFALCIPRHLHYYKNTESCFFSIIWMLRKKKTFAISICCTKHAIRKTRKYQTLGDLSKLRFHCLFCFLSYAYIYKCRFFWILQANPNFWTIQHTFALKDNWMNAGKPYLEIEVFITQNRLYVWANIKEKGAMSMNRGD